MPRCGGCEGVCRCRLEASPRISVTGNGQPTTPFKPDIKRSAGIGNTVELRSDGLYVGQQQVNPVVLGDTATIDASGDGTPANPIRADLRLADAFGAFGSGSNGLVASSAGIAAPPDHATRYAVSRRAVPVQGEQAGATGAGTYRYAGAPFSAGFTNNTRRRMRVLILASLRFEVSYNAPTQAFISLEVSRVGGNIIETDQERFVYTSAGGNMNDRRRLNLTADDTLDAGQARTWTAVPVLDVLGFGFNGLEVVGGSMVLRVYGFTE